MTAIERHIKEAEIQMIDLVKANFSVLLEKIRGNAEFLAEMNATHDPGANYEVAYVATPAEIPDLEGIKPLSGIENHIEEVIERLGLEATDVKALIPLDRWKGLCNYVITGHKNGMEVSAQWVTETLISQGLATTTDQEKHLEQLRGVRRAMLAKDMDLQTAKSQNGVDVWEWSALEALAKENGLK